MTHADRRIVRAYADLQDVDAVIRHLNMHRSDVAEVVVNVCGFSPNAARALLTGRTVPFLAGIPTAPEEQPARYEQPSTRPAGITGKELQVLLALADGLTYDQMARRLNRSQHTLRTHLRAAYHRLGVTTGVDAVRVARELGILETPPSTMPPPAVAAGLSLVEWDTLRRAATRVSCADIGRAMGVSETCARSRLARVYTKLGVNCRWDAINAAVDAGMIERPLSGDAA